jgi:hypothetical protein
VGDGFAHEVSLDRNIAWGLSALGVTTKCISPLSLRRYNLLMKVPAHEVNGEAAMSEALARIQQRARELASSGKFAGWRAITFELQFEPALKDIFWFHSEAGEEAFQWVHSLAAKEEIDRLCDEARHPSARRDPAAA